MHGDWNGGAKRVPQNRWHQISSDVPEFIGVDCYNHRGIGLFTCFHERIKHGVVTHIERGYGKGVRVGDTENFGSGDEQYVSLLLGEMGWELREQVRYLGEWYFIP